MEPSATDLAWAAGFIDGEGCITIPTRLRAHNRRDYSLSLYVGQVDPSPLNLLAAMFGGVVVQRKTPPHGRRPIFMWRITGNAAEQALRALRPYLRVKADQADLAFELREGVRAYVQIGRRVDDAETARRVDIIARLKAAKWRSFEEGGGADG